MKKTKTILILIGVITSLFSCKKGDPYDNTIALLTKAGWKQTDNEYNIGSTPTSDWSTYPDCQKDNITTFKIDQTYTETDGDTKCDPTDPDIIEDGHWEYFWDGKTLNQDGLRVIITTLDEYNLVLVTESLGQRRTYRH